MAIADNSSMVQSASLRAGILVNRRGGFTLVEIMISIVILSVALFGVASVTVSVIKTNALSRDKTAAVMLAKEQMERLKNLPYADSDLDDSNSGNNGDFTETNLLSQTATDHVDTSNPIDNKGQTTGQRIFNRYWNIADDFQGYTGTKTIAVIVSWQRHGSAKYVYLTTVRSD